MKLSRICEAVRPSYWDENPSLSVDEMNELRRAGETVQHFTVTINADYESKSVLDNPLDNVKDEFGDPTGTWEIYQQRVPTKRSSVAAGARRSRKADGNWYGYKALKPAADDAVWTVAPDRYKYNTSDYKSKLNEHNNTYFTRSSLNELFKKVMDKLLEDHHNDARHDHEYTLPSFSDVMDPLIGTYRVEADMLCAGNPKAPGMTTKSYYNGYHQDEQREEWNNQVAMNVLDVRIKGNR